MKMRKETCAHKNPTADVGTIENFGKGFMIFLFDKGLYQCSDNDKYM